MHCRARKPAVAILAGLLVGLSFGANPAAAQCAGSQDVDVCLVGAWNQTGGGEVEWMIRNLPSASRLMDTSQNKQVMVLNSDGSYWTAPAKSAVTIQVEGASGVIRPGSSIKIKSSGRWSAANGSIHLCGNAGASPAGKPMQMKYRCSAEGLETFEAMPGMREPIATRYKRATTKQAGQ